MSLINTYRRYIYQLTAGVDFLRDGLGRLYAGTYGAVADGLLEGVRQAFVQSLPGHPEQTADSLDQVGADRGLFKYRDEPLASWASRVANAWEAYEQSGTSIQVLRAVNEWGAILFPSTWHAANVFLVEGVWARFTVFLLPGTVSWQAAYNYGSGAVYGQADAFYGVSHATTEDLSTFVRIVKKWKPERSRGTGRIVLSGHVYGEPLLTYGGGTVYGPASTIDLGL